MPILQDEVLSRAAPCHSLDFSSFSDERFELILEAADELLAIHRALQRDRQTVLTELLRDVPSVAIDRWQHYPADDSQDSETGAMFYYHAHEAGERPEDEHGHLHLFIRAPSGEGFSHVVACSMAADGRLRSLFTTNRWVTDETWCSAEHLISVYRDEFVIDRARPSWLVVRWLMALTQVLSPYIDSLLRARDQVVAEFAGGISAVAENRDLHVITETPVDLFAVLVQIQQEGIRRYSA
ncbi:DUF6969 family protein [Halothiobacillus sp. DCM-1]|uniref:DUF6969 family protein n=1 Tax=Halothiobacillus sp. DCM-1 TaxID=3112558 RepID=UPI003244B776